MYTCCSYVNMHIYYTILRIKKYYIIYIPCIIWPFCSSISASTSAQHSIFYSLSCIALYANNKTPEPIGHFILTINPQDLFFRQELLFPIQLSSLPITYSYLISCSMTIPDWNWMISFSAETTLMLAISLLTRSLSNSGIWQVCFSRKLSISFNRCS